MIHKTSVIQKAGIILRSSKKYDIIMYVMLGINEPDYGLEKHWIDMKCRFNLKAEYCVQWAERLDVETIEFILHSEVEKGDG